MTLCALDIKTLREEIRNTHDQVSTTISPVKTDSCELQSKVSHLLHAVQSLASILHLTTRVL